MIKVKDSYTIMYQFSLHLNNVIWNGVLKVLKWIYLSRYVARHKKKHNRALHYHKASSLRNIVSIKESEWSPKTLHIFHLSWQKPILLMSLQIPTENTLHYYRESMHSIMMIGWINSLMQSPPYNDSKELEMWLFWPDNIASVFYSLILMTKVMSITCWSMIM